MDKTEILKAAIKDLETVDNLIEQGQIEQAQEIAVDLFGLCQMTRGGAVVTALVDTLLQGVLERYTKLYS